MEQKSSKENTQKSKRIVFTMETLIKKFVEVSETPEVLQEELSMPPMSNLLSHYPNKPINCEADPHFYP